MQHQVECPQCLGTGEYMEGKKTKGFHYKPCKLCNQTGKVEQQIADDFIFANSGEDNFETNDDW